MQTMVSFMMDALLFKKFLMVRLFLFLVNPWATPLLVTDISDNLSLTSRFYQSQLSHSLNLFFKLSDHGELSILGVVAKDMTEIGLKKCGRRLLSILTERYQINLKAFSKMLVAVILNTDSNES